MLRHWHGAVRTVAIVHSSRVLGLAPVADLLIMHWNSGMFVAASPAKTAKQTEGEECKKDHSNDNHWNDNIDERLVAQTT